MSFFLGGKGKHLQSSTTFDVKSPDISDFPGASRFSGFSSQGPTASRTKPHTKPSLVEKVRIRRGERDFLG